VKWKLGASHLLEVCWKGWKEGEERGEKGANLIASFLHSMDRILGSPTKISCQKTVKATITVGCLHVRDEPLGTMKTEALIEFLE
jgi:hypothetical protein